MNMTEDVYDLSYKLLYNLVDTILIRQKKGGRFSYEYIHLLCNIFRYFIVWLIVDIYDRFLT